MQIIRDLRLLSYSLNKRIRPRHAFAHERGAQCTLQMLKRPDAVFASKLNATVEDYLTFRAGYEYESDLSYESFVSCNRINSV